ncbi:MAG: Zn-ribbon domain-containing OB-fold protein [Actinomycetes bacterium]
METRSRVPAVPGWFTLDDTAPALLGGKCTECGTYVFPNNRRFCPNPRCASETFEQVELSRTGRIWSYTNARYQPPPPYIPTADPHEPFAIAAVELEAERLVVMGQVVHGVGVDQLHVGMPVELVLDVLYTEDDTDYLVWKWQPDV